MLLQELHTGVYFCQTEDVACFDMAESIPGSGTDFIGALAKECGVVLVSSLFERRAPGLYHNTAVVFERAGDDLAGRGGAGRRSRPGRTRPPPVPGHRCSATPR